MIMLRVSGLLEFMKAVRKTQTGTMTAAEALRPCSQQSRNSRDTPTICQDRGSPGGRRGDGRSLKPPCIQTHNY
jgi:hypothetical protein